MEWKENINSRLGNMDKPPIARPRGSVRETKTTKSRAFKGRKTSAQHESIEVLGNCEQQASINENPSPYKSNLYSFK